MRERARGSGLAALLVAVLVVVLVTLSCQAQPSPSLAPDPTDPPTAVIPPTSPVVVSLGRVDGGSIAHVGYPVELSAAALAMTGIAVIELWAGGDLVESLAPRDPARPAATARWAWTPTAVGEAILVARAYDADGLSGQSAAVRVDVVADPPISYSLVEVVAGEGRTLDEIVAAHGGDASVAEVWNADLPDGPVPAGTVVNVPILDPPVPPGPTASTGGTIGLTDARLAADRTAIVPSGLATPSIDVAVADCTITAKASGGTDSTAGFAFSVLPPISNSFVALPPIAGSGGAGSTSFAALGGTNYVMVSAFSTTATALSRIVPAALPPECSASGWTGDARLDGGRLITNGAADRAYLYVNVGDTGWQRVPAAPGTFVEAGANGLDFGALLPGLGGAAIKLEAWGWRAGELVALGAGTYAPPSEPLYAGVGALGVKNLVGFGTNLDIVTQGAGGEFAEQLAKDWTIERPGPSTPPSPRTFKWATALPGITHIQWQILPYPLLDSTTPRPPFRIDTGTVEVQGLTTGYFSIDLKPYLVGAPTGVTSAVAWGQSQLVSPLANANVYLPSGTPAPGDVLINPNGIWIPPSPSPAPGTPTGGAAGSTAGTVDDLSLLMPPLSALYIRVIPYVGTTPVGDPSNTVSFTILEPGDPQYLSPPSTTSPPTYPGAYLQSIVFHPPTGSNPTFFNCVRVVSGGFNNVYGDWSDGTVHCKPTGGGGWSPLKAFEKFVAWVGSVWDYIAYGYDWIQDKLVDTVLAFVPCEQIADQVADDGKGVCHKIAKTALHAVMAAYGIPPEIPTWEETIAAYKGDLRAFILTQAYQFPAVEVACTAAYVSHEVKSSFPTCEAIVDKAIDEAVALIVEQKSKAASSSAGVAVPYGVIVEPDPRGIPQPPRFEVTITRTNEPLPTGVVCTLTGRMTSTVWSWTWFEYEWSNGTAKVVQKSGPVTGEPYHRAQQVVAPLAPGQSAAYQLWLTKSQAWFEPDGWNDHAAQQYAEWNGEFNHAWVLTQKGATVVGSLSGNCITGNSFILTLDGQAWK